MALTETATRLRTTPRVRRLPPDEHTAPSHLSLAAAYTITKLRQFQKLRNLTDGKLRSSATTHNVLGFRPQLQRLLESQRK
jgi:hypothetical protein